MRLLLINSNPVVARMMKMGVAKAGFELEECESVYDLPKGEYEIVMIDDEMYDENLVQTLKNELRFQKIGLITTSKGLPKGIDFVLHKPFLPTDLLELLRKLKSELESASTSTPSGDCSQEEKEQIVEIEEIEEESPFIEEPLEKAGVLKEEDVAEVANLLDEDRETLVEVLPEAQEKGEEIQEEQSEEEKAQEHKAQEKLPQEEESSQEKEPSQEESPQELVSEEEVTPEEMLTEISQEKTEEEEAEESVQPMNEVLLEEGTSQESVEEERSEEIAEVADDVQGAPPQEEAREKQDEVQEKPLQEEEPHQELVNEEESAAAETLTDVLQKEDAGVAHLQKVGQEIRSLGIQGLKDILNGMQLEITIKISYPDRKDV